MTITAADQTAQMCSMDTLKTWCYSVHICYVRFMANVCRCNESVKVSVSCKASHRTYILNEYRALCASNLAEFRVFGVLTDKSSSLIDTIIYSSAVDVCYMYI